MRYTINCESGGTLGPAHVELQSCKHPTMNIIQSTGILIGGVWLLVSGLAVAGPLGTAFTYQGRLTDAGADAKGKYDLRLALYTTSARGVPMAPITNLNVAVSNGLFTTTLDFGAGVFTGDAYWL